MISKFSSLPQMSFGHIFFHIDSPFTVVLPFNAIQVTKSKKRH